MIKLVLVKDNGDGLGDYSFEYSKEFLQYYQAQTGAKLIRKANVGKFIQKLIIQALTESTPNN